MSSTSTTYYLYKTTHRPTGKYYIGRRAIRGKEPEQDKYLGSGIRLLAAIRAHGIKNFIKEIMYRCNSYEDLVIIEKFVVTQQVLDDPLCYNLAPGGEGGYTKYYKGLWHWDEANKQRISKMNRGRKRPDIAKAWAEGRMTSWWKGKTRSIEDRKRKSEANRRNFANGTHGSFKKKQCPHCNIVVTITNAKRWHFDNCKKINPERKLNPNHPSVKLVFCPYCKQHIRCILRHYHFENCKSNPDQSSRTKMIEARKVRLRAAKLKKVK